MRRSARSSDDCATCSVRGARRGRSEPAPPAPHYPDRFDVLSVVNAQGEAHRAQSPAEWEPRRQHIRAALERVMGPFPNPAKRVALNPVVVKEVTLAGGLVRRLIAYQSDPTDRVHAYLFLPSNTSASAKRPAVLCLQQLLHGIGMISKEHLLTWNRKLHEIAIAVRRFAQKAQCITANARQGPQHVQRFRTPQRGIHEVVGLSCRGE